MPALLKPALDDLPAPASPAALGQILKLLQQRACTGGVFVVIQPDFGQALVRRQVPGVEGARDGRDHHPFGFSVVMAGGGLKGGIAHGATDEIGFHAVENRHYVTDIHATVLHLLGFHADRFSYKFQGLDAKLIGINPAKPVKALLA